jgi:hypothetical protein
LGIELLRMSFNEQQLHDLFPVPVGMAMVPASILSGCEELQ